VNAGNSSRATSLKFSVLGFSACDTQAAISCLMAALDGSYCHFSKVPRGL
jgi:hypothetical protein